MNAKPPDIAISNIYYLRGAMFKKSISAVVLLNVAIVVFLATTVLVYYISSSARKMLVKQQESTMFQVAVSVNKAFDEYLDGIEKLLFSVAQQAVISDNINGSSHDGQNGMEAIASKYPTLNYLLAFDKRGEIIAGFDSITKKKLTKNVSDREYYKSIMAGEELFIQKTLLKSKADGSLFFAMSRPLKDKNGVTVGGVTIVPSWSAFTEKFINPVRFGERGYPFVLDGQGRVIAQPVDPDLILVDFSKYDFIQKVMQQKEGSFKYKYEGKDKILAFSTNEVTGWKFIMTAYEDELAASASHLRNILISAGIFLLVLITAIIVLLIRRLIALPLKKIDEFAGGIASGNLTTHLSGNFKYEFQGLSKSLEQMRGNLAGMIGNISQGVTTLSASSSEMNNISETMLTAAGDASEKTGKVAGSTEDMNNNIASVSAAMEESATNTEMVASAIEEMSATIEEIAKDADKARGVTKQAVEKSIQTSEKMSELGKSADKIGKVTETITEISEQTNLLALNATIEAARAGEAGKGFAVVANEIKDLARQTANATVDIKNQIDEMQQTTISTVTDIEAVSKIIKNINTVITTMAAAVEQQATSTIKISNNIAQVAGGISDVNENVAQSNTVVSEIVSEISMVSQISQDVDSGSKKIQTSAKQLLDLAEQLNGMIKEFQI